MPVPPDPPPVPPRASAWQKRRRGYLLAAVATASWSPDAVLPRLARRHYGGNTLNIVFWKFVLVGAINLIYAASLAPRGSLRGAAGRAIISAQAGLLCGEPRMKTSGLEEDDFAAVASATLEPCASARKPSEWMQLCRGA